MTPKDLLTNAAKTAGYSIWWKEGVCKGGEYEAAFIGDKPWNPRDDNGDAFRLAAELGFDLKFGESGQASLNKDGDWYGTSVGPRCGDPAASMRMAIVRLAANQQSAKEVHELVYKKSEN